MTTYREVFNEWLDDWDNGCVIIKIGDTGRDYMPSNSLVLEICYPITYEREFCIWMDRGQAFECKCGNSVSTIDKELDAYQGLEDEVKCYDCIVSPAEQEAEEASRGLGILGNA